jgi:hypothetical protein
MEASEAELSGDVIDLLEKVVSPRDNTIPIKIIRPGEGSSGFYPKEVLRRDGPKVFVKGTQMFWDHPTDQEESERPEGSLRNLAAELVEDARYDENGADGPGLYSKAKVFGSYKEAVDELAPSIGLSIRASGKRRNGQVGGKAMPIIEEITRARSVDFVTKAGAGGKVVGLFEAARGRNSNSEESTMTKEEEKALSDAQAAVGRLTEENKSLSEKFKLLQTDSDRMKEAGQLREASDFVKGVLDKAEGLTARAKTRLLEALVGKAPRTDGKIDAGKFTEAVNAAVAEEVAYLAEAAGGKIRGMGDGIGADKTQVPDPDKNLSESISKLTGIKRS